MKRSLTVLFLWSITALGQIGPIGGGGGSVKSVTYDNNASLEIHGAFTNPGTTALLSLSLNDNTIVPFKLTLSATQRLIGRNTAGAGGGEEIQIGTALDWIGNTRGAILYRGASGWSILAPSVGILTSAGAGTDPAWVTDANEKTANKDQASGYAGLNGSGKISNSELSGVELSANKGAVSGYAPLDASQHVPNANLGTGAVGAGAKALFDDHTFKSLTGGGSVVDVAVTTANGVSGVSDHDATTPTLTLTLGAITPTTIVASSTISGSNLSGSNTGDQTISLTGNVTGTGTGTFAATIASNAVTYAKFQQAANAYRLLGNPTNAAGNYSEVSVQAAQFASGALKLYAPSQTLSGTTPTADAAVSKIFYITLSGNTTIGLSNFGDGDSIAFRVKQAHTGGPYTVAITGVTNWQGGSQPVQTVTADKADWIMLQKTAVGIDAIVQANF